MSDWRHHKRRDQLDLQLAALNYGLKDATRHAWGDNTERIGRALGRAPTDEDLAGGIEATRSLQPALPAANRNEVILRAALRANVRSTAEADILARASARFAETVPSAEEADEFMRGLRTEASHLFVPSVGAGAAGSRGVSAGPGASVP